MDEMKLIRGGKPQPTVGSSDGFCAEARGQAQRKRGLGHTVALHGEDWCHLCGKTQPENLDIWGEHVGYTRLCYDCLHHLYYMLRRVRNKRVKAEIEEMENEFGYR